MDGDWRNRKFKSEVLGEMACRDHIKMCTMANERFFFFFKGLYNEITEQKRKF